MELKSLTSPDLVFVDENFKSKNEAISFLVNKLYENGKVTSEKSFFQAVLDREKLSPTGFEGGLAIPHGKSNVVKEASFAVATVKQPITDWESIDPNNQVKLIFLLAIPESESGSTHLNVLSELVTRLTDETYKQRLISSKDRMELFNNLDADEVKVTSNEMKLNKTILAVTACPAGIAHTYMAAEALVKAGNELGVKVFVEKQGANGIEDRHSAERLKMADAVIFANDVAIKDEERFSHLPKVKTTVATPLKNAKSLIEKAVKLSETESKGEYKSTSNGEGMEDSGKKTWQIEMKDSLLTGISYMIPIIIAGGMTLTAAVFIAQAFGLQDLYQSEGSWLWYLRQLGGGLLGQLMVPVLAAYMAYSIADKPALGPGFAAGLAANLIGSGFLGGMLGGLLAGYFMKWLKKTVQPKGTFAGFVSFWIYPVVGTLVVGSIMLLIVGEPLAWINVSLTNWLDGLSGTSNALILGAVIGAMVSTDLGGPVNKAAYAFCIASMANGNFVPYATFASVKMVSAFSVTGATVLGKELFNKEEKEIGKQTWLLGLAGITEGAIPFAISDPLRVLSSFIIGSMVTGAIVAYYGIELSVPGAGIFSLGLLDGQPILLAGLIWLGAALIGEWVKGTGTLTHQIMEMAMDQSNGVGQSGPKETSGPKEPEPQVG
ncbi:PTS 2-O-a-mannosyl-D-glycerate transporter subunit IIABC [Fervidibacillus halotolerans]|uniref:PTS 2-O-a-mannosyl-D-glycerate transporter subunit IIABC n=1 Tax=Fervidibacillus halotolerans TaxID=2980027 RepID=A0A9E8LYV5_9BACI|nr:PTS 2-O-a-mannosyl-D-glycerate transporter subunit IIABC [Fervidibacillus halotolerans]WAA12096.1 PTS 2-O-a-mannosyl-D-glycerate transporter subunit IIABC [Fervidibacillus halotolerans]